MTDEDRRDHRIIFVLCVTLKSAELPLFDAVLTEIGANNGLIGRLNHAEAAAPEFGVEFSNW